MKLKISDGCEIASIMSASELIAVVFITQLENIDVQTSPFWSNYQVH